MRITTLYDSGTAKIEEDGIIVRPPFVGVADGVSGVYHPGDGPMEFEDRSGGQMAVDCFIQTFFQESVKTNLEQVISQANKKVKECNDHKGIGMQESDRLAGAVFAAAKIRQKEVDIIQVGDCSALWVHNDGKIGITKNQVFPYEIERLEKIKELMKKHKGNRSKMWEEFTPFLRQSRREHVNVNYGVLNGQPKLFHCYTKLTISKPSLLILGTDGLIPYLDNDNNDDFALNTVVAYRHKGLKAILEYVRNEEEKKKHESHVDYAEATGIAVEF